MTITKITDNLYLGSYHDIINKLYVELNINVIINFATECNNLSIDDNLIYYKFDYDDDPSENLYHNFNNVSTIINDLIISKKNVLLHCYAGKSRSVTFIIAYMMKYMNYDLLTAYNYIKKLRNIYPNIGFINQLIRYEKELSGKITLDYDNFVVKYIHDNVNSNILIDQIKLIYESSNKDISLTIDKIFSL